MAPPCHLLLRLVVSLLVTTLPQLSSYQLPSSSPLLPPQDTSRRGALRSGGGLAAALSFLSRPTSPAVARGNDDEPLPSLRQRVEGSAAAPSNYMLESPDVFYPDWFNGIWSTESTTLGVEAPAGIGLFGGNRSYQVALDDVGQTINYETRFRLLRSSAAPKVRIVADREFNIASIIRSTMGKQAVLDVPTGQNDDPNRIVFILSPAGADGAIFRAELRATGRHVEGGTTTAPIAAGAAAVAAAGVGEGAAALASSSPAAESSTGTVEPAAATTTESFDVLEAVRQVVTADRSSASAMAAPSPPPLIKDIETTTLYTKVGEDRIEALQRTASFLVPSTNSDPLKAAAIQRMGGRAVDIRTYRVVYKLKRRLETKEKDEQQA